MTQTATILVQIREAHLAGDALIALERAIDDHHATRLVGPARTVGPYDLVTTIATDPDTLGRIVSATQAADAVALTLTLPHATEEAPDA